MIAPWKIWTATFSQWKRVGCIIVVGYDTSGWARDPNKTRIKYGEEIIGSGVVVVVVVV